jgi:hypothetical protein
LAVTDNLAGGVESINFEITKNHTVEPSPFDNQWAVHVRRFYFTIHNYCIFVYFIVQQNLRDERSEAFAIKLESGEVPSSFHIFPLPLSLPFLLSFHTLLKILILFIVVSICLLRKSSGARNLQRASCQG